MIRSLTKDIDTYRRRDATYEASILNFNTSCRGPASNARGSSTFGAESQRSFLECSIPYGRANQVRQASALFGTLFRRSWGTRRANRHATSKPDNLSEHPSFLDDVSEAILGRSKVVEASNGMKVRGTELNENGFVTLMNGEFKKSELIAKVSVRAATFWTGVYANDKISMACSLETLEKSIPHLSPKS